MLKKQANNIGFEIKISDFALRPTGLFVIKI